ncbi:16S rRNA (guanine966-N2)-methyltransferase [Humidesulfovibrio mexicanus]|uniref:16S rRNA (Guanine966-N2)-methyltransferase n=1 Tax=Humidesulfovibrio mexicanus TaxID=147047 RepID=A0A238XNQ9_9BACT|nr:16S rRNA (guanine(966)-N(2))-methyltransferase RsmD [Humidesulfovibrio mexicanus]SNR60083.1 16S rRNA (guanine966-N2)-methyltransferase [Humidesulfovibrio mexicanus]
MRIISGEYGGRSIRTVEGPGYRPATAKVRQAVFSMLEARGVLWPGSRVLDLFAGSGSLALEALSRGADEAWFLDKNPRAVSAIKATLAELGVRPSRARVLAADLLKALAREAPAPFDIVFVDPPYGLDLLPPAMEKAVRGGWIAEGGLVLAEVEARCDFADRLPAELIPQADRLYGQTRILLWRNSTQGSQSTPEPSIL